MVAPLEPHGAGTPSPSKKRRTNAPPRNDGKADDLPSTNSSPTKRGRRRCLSLINSIPLDVFLEIASHLHPMDILTLARTTKSYRALLMSKSKGKPFWRAARDSLAMPECPADISEAQYAFLVFGTECQFCGKTSRTWYQAFALRLHVCHPCARESMKRGHNLVMTPRQSESYSWTTELFRRTGELVEELKLLVPHASYPNAKYTSEVDKARPWFYPPMAQAIMQTRDEKYASTSLEEYQAWVEQRKEIVQSLMHEAKILESWWKGHQEYVEALRKEKSLARSVKANLRKTAIFNRLLELGHEQVDLVFRDERNGKELEKIWPLTEDAWVKIRGPFEEEAQRNRRARFSVTRKAELAHIHADRSPLNMIPLQEFLHLPATFPLWTESPWDTICWSDELRASIKTSLQILFTMVESHLDSITQLADGEAFPGAAPESSIQSYLDKVDIKKKKESGEGSGRIEITAANLNDIGRSPREVDLGSRLLPCSRGSTEFPPAPAPSSLPILSSAKPDWSSDSALLDSPLPDSPPVPAPAPAATQNAGLFIPGVYSCSKCHEALFDTGVLSHACIFDEPIKETPPAWYSYRSVIWRDTMVYSSKLHSLVMLRIAETARAWTLGHQAPPDTLDRIAMVCLCCMDRTPRGVLDYITHFTAEYHRERCILGLKQRVISMPQTETTPALRRWAQGESSDGHDPTKVKNICAVLYYTPPRPIVTAPVAPVDEQPSTPS